MSNTENRQSVVDAIRHEEAKHHFEYYTEKVVWKNLVNKFADHMTEHTFFLDNCILKDFPLSEQLLLLEPWVEDAYFWCWGPMMWEIMKMAYLIAPTYLSMNWRDPPRTYPHTALFRCFDTIRNNLLSLLQIKDADDFYAMVKARYNHIRCKQLYFTHMSLLPLLGDKGLEILEHVATRFPYGDAEEGLCFAMAHFNIKDHNVLSVIRRIFINWDDCSMIGFTTSSNHIGTAMQVWLEKYQFDARRDPILGPIIRNNRIIR